MAWICKYPCVAIVALPKLHLTLACPLPSSTSTSEALTNHQPHSSSAHPQLTAAAAPKTWNPATRGDPGSPQHPTPNTQLAQAGEGPRQRYGAAATGLGLLSTGYPETSAQIADTLHRRVPFRSTMHPSLFPIVRLASPCLTSPRLCCSLRLSNDLRENYVTSGVLAQWESGDALSSPASYPAPAVSPCQFHH